MLYGSIYLPRHLLSYVELFMIINSFFESFTRHDEKSENDIHQIKKDQNSPRPMITFLIEGDGKIQFGLR